MKKLLLILFGTLILSGTQAQVLFEESFSGGVIPVPGWLIMGNTTNFASPATANAGGTAPELQFLNNPPFPTTTMRIISPQVNTTGATQVIIRFKHMFDHVDGTVGSFTMGVDTRSSNGAWNNVWTKATTVDINAETVTVLVNNANVGSSSFQLSFVINGSSQNMKDWFIDDVEVLNPLELDGAMASVELPPLFVGVQPIKGKFSNLGTTVITSADVNWQVGADEVYTTSFTDLSIAMGANGDYLSTDSLDLPAGNYTLKVWLSNINGLTGDDNLLNDTITKELSIPEQLVYYKPFFEEFTSSTCAPCASFNNSVFNPFLAQHTDDDLTLIKYQMNWPGSGDPYYTAEGGVRRDYYGVNAVPMLFVDGKNVATTSAAVNAAYNASSGLTCYVSIESTHEVQGNNVIIDANIVPYASYSNVKVHIAVIEKRTTQNVASNGETEFHHVMMKMVPNASGTTANLVAGEPINYKHTVDMSSTNVEEMDDLMVVIFIQQTNKAILQSGYSTEVGALVSSNLPDDAINVSVSEPIIFNFTQGVRKIGGEVLTNDNVADVIVFKQEGPTGDDVSFTATINAAKTQIIITPSPNLAYNVRHYLKVIALENYVAVPTLPYIINFTTLLNIGIPTTQVSEFNLFPNPVNNTLFVSKVDNIKEIEIYSVVGNLIRTIDMTNQTGQYSINVSDLTPGLYFLKAKGLNKDKTVRFVVAR